MQGSGVFYKGGQCGDSMGVISLLIKIQRRCVSFADRRNTLCRTNQKTWLSLFQERRNAA